MRESIWISYGQTLHLSAAATVSSQQMRGNKMTTKFGSHGWRDRKLREWLLLLLRYAVTQEPSDRSAVLAMGEELDSIGQWRPSAPRFFLKISVEVCTAIPAPNDWDNHRVLLRHITRIEDLRLRRAFRAAVGLEEAVGPQQQAEGKRRNNQNLWKGLPTNRVVARPL
jgi:hypothetical protein